MKRFDLLFATALAALSLAAPTLAGCSDDGGNPDDGLLPGTDASAETSPGFQADGDVDAPVPDAIPGDAACGGTEMRATARDANLLLVLDQSGSMLQTPPGYPMRKWDAVKSALRTALEPAASKLSLGLELFPHDPAGPIGTPCTSNCCAMPAGSAAITVPIGSGAATLDEIVSQVNATSPGGATPTADALDAALAYFTSGAGKSLPGDKYVLLATDGGPNCNEGLTCDAATCTSNIDGSCGAGNCCDPTTGGSRISCLDQARVIEKLNALRAAGVKTFVVGIPGTEAYESSLDAFADAGGMPNTSGPHRYYKVAAEGGVGALVDVFTDITGALITSCRLQLESAPPNASEVNVYVDGVLVPQGGVDGWELDTSTNPPTLVLKGGTCGQVEGKGVKAISVVYGCATIY